MSRDKSGGHDGFVLKERPSEYNMTEQQERFRKVADRCGIERGISREELKMKMKNCIPREWEKLKGENDGK